MYLHAYVRMCARSCIRTYTDSNDLLRTCVFPAAPATYACCCCCCCDCCCCCMLLVLLALLLRTYVRTYVRTACWSTLSSCTRSKASSSSAECWKDAQKSSSAECWKDAQKLCPPWMSQQPIRRSPAEVSCIMKFSCWSTGEPTKARATYSSANIHNAGWAPAQNEYVRAQGASRPLRVRMHASKAALTTVMAEVVVHPQDCIRKRSLHLSSRVVVVRHQMFGRIRGHTD